MKRGQITIAIIGGIVILLLLGIILYVYTTVVTSQIGAEEEEAARLVGEAEEIQRFVDRCTAMTTFEGLEVLGKQGGRIAMRGELSFQKTSYWYLDEINVQPMLNQSLIELQQYIDANIENCAAFDEFKKKGFSIEAGKPRSAVFFGLDTVVVELYYPLTVEKEDFKKEFKKFHAELDVRYRKVHELASRIVVAELMPEFDITKPLLGVEKKDFEVALKRLANSTIAFTITDKTRMEQQGHFSFTFANRFGRSNVTRVIELQANSHYVPTTLPYTVYSPDRMAQLRIATGTTMSRKGSAVEGISAQQFYPPNVTRENTPFHELADNSVIKQNLTWNLTYPLYEFSPTGMRFNKPQELRIYWDEENNPAEGGVGILYSGGKGGWRPLRATVNYSGAYADTSIPGFSSYTVVSCKKQPIKQVSATAELDPGSGCVITIVGVGFAMVAALALGLGGFAVGVFEIAMNSLGTLLTAAMPFFYAGAYFAAAEVARELTYDTQQDIITFTPTCSQYINVVQEDDDADGKCIPSGTIKTKKGKSDDVKARGDRRNKDKPAGGGGDHGPPGAAGGGDAPKEHTVEITAAGFVPGSLAITTGDKVVFVNKDVKGHWPASAMHPTHKAYPEEGGCIGSLFDACKELAQGESYAFTFTKKGTWEYHDHSNPTITGKIVVKDASITSSSKDGKAGKKDKKGKKGKENEGKHDAPGGKPVTIMAQVKGCTGWWPCSKCSTTCSVEYK